MKKQVENLYDFCYGAENSYYKDKDITDIFHNGITPENILEASRTVKYKEKSMFLRLPVNFISQANARTSKSIEELLEIVESIYKDKEFEAVLESIELSGDEYVILDVLGPFSTLLQNIDSNTLFKWLYKYKSQMHFALEKITESLSAYINTALSKGANIISLAEPSAIINVIGENRYKEFVIYYIVKLLRDIESSITKNIVHICPIISYQLESYGYLTREVLSCQSQSYGQALIEIAQNSSIKYVGHRCINAEHAKVDKIYALRGRLTTF